MGGIKIIKINKKIVKEYTFITIGNFILTIAINSFMAPNNFIAGGVSGLSILINYTLHFPIGMTNLFFNIIIFILGFKLLGMKFGMKSIVSTIILSFMIDFFKYVIPLPTYVAQSGDMMLVIIYTAILSGIGLGIVFYQGSSTGGTDIIALIFKKYFHVSPGQGLWIIDIAITVSSMFVPNIGVRNMLYGVFAVVISGWMIDIVIEGFANLRTVLIISDKHKEVAEFIMKEMERGVTYLYGQGAYTGKDKKIIMTVVRFRELVVLKAKISKIDPKAFVFVNKVSEIEGKGFSN